MNWNGQIIADLFSLSTEELIQWYVETPDIIEKNLKQLIALEGKKGQQEAQEYLTSAIEVLESHKTFAEVAKAA